MKILLLQNRYLPTCVGGYEQACQNMAEGLRKRGHQVAVLTATLGDPQVGCEPWVWRALKVSSPSRTLEAHILQSLSRGYYNNRLLRRMLRKFRPDVIQVWCLSGVPGSLFITAQQSGLPVTYYFHDRWPRWETRSDRWLQFWNYPSQRQWRRIAKRLLQTVGIKRITERWLAPWFSRGDVLRDPTQAAFVSDSCQREYQESGYSVQGSRVIYNGVDLTHFYPSHGRRAMPCLRLLYVGRIVASKGIHVLVEALVRLWNEPAIPCHLDIIGPVQDLAYREKLIVMARSGGILDHISFHDPLPHDVVPQCYRDHDVLIFPSIGIERFPLVILEAMASGLPAITTFTGGHREFLKDGQTCLTCCPGDPGDLADKIALLAKNPSLTERLAYAGMNTVRQQFSLDQILNQMEVFLYEASHKPASGIAKLGVPGAIAGNVRYARSDSECKS